MTVPDVNKCEGCGGKYQRDWEWLRFVAKHRVGQEAVTDWGDRTSRHVLEALTKHCQLCKAQPGQDCRNSVTGEPMDRIVHFCRAELVA